MLNRKKEKYYILKYLYEKHCLRLTSFICFSSRYITKYGTLPLYVCVCVHVYTNPYLPTSPPNRRCQFERYDRARLKGGGTPTDTHTHTHVHERGRTIHYVGFPLLYRVGEQLIIPRSFASRVRDIRDWNLLYD